MDNFSDIGHFFIQGEEHGPILLSNTRRHLILFEFDFSLIQKEKEIAKTVPPLTGTLIYRYNGTNIGNLVPKEKDIQTGLSFFTVPPTNGRPYFVTTIEALNSSGVLVAVRDSPIHVSVRPRGATMRDWIDAGKYSIWTHTVYYLSIKCRG